MPNKLWKRAAALVLAGALAAGMIDPGMVLAESTGSAVLEAADQETESVPNGAEKAASVEAIAEETPEAEEISAEDSSENTDESVSGTNGTDALNNATGENSADENASSGGETGETESGGSEAADPSAADGSGSITDASGTDGSVIDPSVATDPAGTFPGATLEDPAATDPTAGTKPSAEEEDSEEELLRILTFDIPEETEAQEDTKALPVIRAQLEREEGFPEGSEAQIELLEGDALNGLAQNLTETLNPVLPEQTKAEISADHTGEDVQSEEGDAESPERTAQQEADIQKEVTALLPLSIGVFDEDGEELTDLGEVTVRLTLTKEDADALQESRLYHQKEDGIWELLEYEIEESEDAEPNVDVDGQSEDETSDANSLVTFTTESFSPFLFVEVTDVEVLPEEMEYTYEDDTIFVRVIAGPEANLPEGATLYAEALAEDSEAYRKAYEAVAGSMEIGEGQRLVFAPYEIGFLDEGGERIEPEEGTLLVEMKLKEDAFSGLEMSDPEDPGVVAHIKEDGSVEYLENSGGDPTAPAFETSSFSVFGPVLLVNDPGDPKSISIDEFGIKFSSGATLTDGKYVWNPTDSARGHYFVYRVNYTVSGTYAGGQRAIQFELPLHILKDRDGSWADTFDCPYLLASEVQEDEEADFVYEIDEENNKVIIYNYKDIPAGEAGYIEIAYVTVKSTLDYADMVSSTKVDATIAVTGSDGQAVMKEAAAEEVFIDTHATINYTQKKQPDYYTKWQESWGEKPANADDYYYLVWPVYTVINKNTSPYNLTLKDTFTDYDGEIVGYRFAGQRSYSEVDTLKNLRGYGERYDYVLTRYSKAKADEVLENANYYDLNNQIQVTVDPVDQMDADTTASSSRKWYYQVPEYVYPTGHFWAEKWGIYIGGSVDDSENISDYTLAEFLEGKEQSIDELEYYTYLEGRPYPWTLADDATDGGQQDAEAGKYGQKKVDYELTDDVFYLNGVTKLYDGANATSSGARLDDADFDLTGIRWEPIMETAVYDKESLSFKSVPIEKYKDEDDITIWVRTGEDDWHRAAVYHMDDGTYDSLDEQYIESAYGKNVAFQKGIKGVRFTFSNAYYYSHIGLHPIVSLNRTDHVLEIIGGENTDETKIRLTNEAKGSVSQNGKELFGRTTQGTDYIQRAEKESAIQKDVTATRNDKLRRQYTVTWRVRAAETYVDNDGRHYILQQSGIFYDLAPSGAVIDKSSVAVQASDMELPSGAYTVSVEENYRNSGRSLLTVQIHEATETDYIFTYNTIHQWEAIQDYGKNLLNSAAYETGNDDIAEGRPDDGGNITDKAWLAGLGDGSGAEKYLYAEARYDIDIVMAANTGLMKQIKGPDDSRYSYSSTVNRNGVYSYQIRLANDAVTRSKDILFFDSLENFYQNPGQNLAKKSDWKGTLTGIDLSNLEEKGIAAEIYLSAMEELNPNDHRDLSETTGDEERIWLPYREFVAQYDSEEEALAEARAIAVDARRASDGTEFVLQEAESIAFTLYFCAPASDESNKEDPVAYNNIYVSRTALKFSEETEQFFHQDYTQIRYRVTGNVPLLKVNADDGASPVYKATYVLRGTSDYGTEYELGGTTARDGTLTFREIEKGSYELLETSCTDDWQLNTELYIVTVHSDGHVTIDGLTEDEDGRFILEDEPRIYADLFLEKRDSVDTNKRLNGVEFRLAGTSDYGNDVLLYATTKGTDGGGNALGRVIFRNIELGTYTLTETRTVEGYIKAVDVWNVKVDERGAAVLYDAAGNVVETSDVYYQLYNEPLHEIQFLKSSTYGTNIYLEGAEFTLSGVSDYGSQVDLTAVSEGEFGAVKFTGLEPGTYSMQETKAPEDHELDNTVYMVKVYADGTFEIPGLEKETIPGMDHAELYNLKNNRTTGVVTVTKIWEDNKTDEERDWIPDMTISTQKPGKNPLGYTITFDANGGSFTGGEATNEVVYADGGKTVMAGSYRIPEAPFADASFSGWYAQADGSGEEYEIGEGGITKDALTGDITVYARWKTPVRYAVSVYGIGVDVDENDLDLGLTFGPALGGDYLNSFVGHTVDESGNITGDDKGTTSGNHPYRCIHQDSWETIISWNQMDPYVYNQCIAHGCTKSVNLDLTKISFGNKEFTPSYTGDGPGALYYELVPTYGTYGSYNNVRWNQIATNSGGWGASGIRAMLNGTDTDDSDEIVTGEGYAARNYTADDCLLAAFPEVLQDVIGARKTLYDSVYNHKTDDNLRYTYDKLWLFSPNELSEKDISNKRSDHNHPLETVEGKTDPYSKWKGMSLSESSGFSSQYKCYQVSSWSGGMSSRSDEYWLRSSYVEIPSYNNADKKHISGISSNGELLGYLLTFPDADDSMGVAPGFSLSRSRISTASTQAASSPVDESRNASDAFPGGTVSLPSAGTSDSDVMATAMPLADPGNGDVEYTTKDGNWISVGTNLWAIDKDKDGEADKESDKDDSPYSIVLSRDGNTWTYRFTVQDPEADYYAWEEQPPAGSKYEIVGGYGTRVNPVSTAVAKVSHTPNLTDTGEKDASYNGGNGAGNYKNNENFTEVVAIPGAEKLQITITFGGESRSYDWACIWAGNHPDYSANDHNNNCITYPEKIGGGSHTSSDNTHTYTVDGDTATFGFRSDGSGYGDGYGYYAVITGIGADGAVITNRSTTEEPPEYGSLSLTKTVTASAGDMADTDRQFRFDITLSSEDPNIAKYLTGVQTFGGVTFADGSASVYLKHGETVTMTDIPAGAKWSIAETSADGYTASWTVDGASVAAGSVSGTIMADQTAAVTCENTKIPPGPEPETGSVKVKKTTVNGTEGDEFRFRMAFWDLEANASYAYTVTDEAGDTEDASFIADVSGMADVQFTLKNGETASFSGLPMGCQYQVLEAGSEGYTASYKIEGSGISAVIGQKANTEAGADLSTAKETLDRGEEATVHFTNSKPAVNPDVLSIPVKKEWVDGDSKENRPESIMVYLLQSDTEDMKEADVIATARLDEASNWSYEFKDLDKYQADGQSPYYYGIQEVRVPGYTTEVTGDAENGYTITNTAEDAGRLKITKTVAGGDETKEFRFTLTLTKDDKPLTGTYELDSTGDGAKTGTLHFDAAGTARFTLKHGESLTVKNLPAGAEYTLAETAYAGYVVEVTKGSLTGTIAKDETVEVNVTNRRLCGLTVTKTVEGSMGDKTKDFDFVLTLTGQDGIVIPSKVTYVKGSETGTLPVEEGKVSFTLAHDERITFQDLPAGLRYDVEESGTIPGLNINGGYDVEVSGEADGTLTEDVTADFVNTRNGTVPTGVTTTVFPSLLIALLGGLGFFWTRIRRKHRRDGE